MAWIRSREWQDENGESQRRVDVTVARKGFRRQTKTFHTKGAAERWARLVEAEMERGAFKSTNEAERMTLGDAIDWFIKEILPKMKSQNPDRSKALIVKHHIGKYPLIAIDRQVLGRYRDKRLAMNARNVRRYKDGRKEIVELDRKVSPATVRHELMLISRVITHLMTEKDIFLPGGNPVASMKLPPVGKPRDRRLSPEEEESLMKILDHTKDETGLRSKYMHSLMVMAIETASRRGELLKLRWDDIDLKLRTATLWDTKNGEDRRIGLSTRAVEALIKLPRGTDGRVFPLTANAVRMVWQRALRRAGIDGLKFHDLRHEATSRLAVKFNGDVMAMSAMTGHKSLQMLKRYTHLRAEELARRLG